MNRSKIIGSPLVRRVAAQLSAGGGPPPPPPSDPVVTLLDKIAGSANGFDAGASTPIEYAGDVEITFSRQVLASQATVGFRDGADAFGESYEMKWGALIADSGAVYYIVNAAFVSTGASVGLAEVVRIARTISDGVVKIYAGADVGSLALVHTFAVTTTDPLAVDTSLATNTSFIAVEVTEGGVPSDPTWSSSSGNLAISKPTIEVDAPSYTAGATVTVTFAIANNARTASWIFIMAVGGNPYVFTPNVIQWQYLNDSHTPPGAPVTSGAVHFIAPSAGNYEVVMGWNDQNRVIVRGVTFTTT
jgi:hypothetical protein